MNLTPLKKFFLAALLIGVLVLPAAPARAVLPTFTTGDVTASAVATKNWLTEAWTYLRDKIATIFFQNILRKVLNDFASDAAQYIAAGFEGQQALYVKDKWSNFWVNVGDKAAGDFIEGFANSVISDIAANDIRGGSNSDVCQSNFKECVAKVDAENDDCVNHCNNESSNPKGCAADCQGLYENDLNLCDSQRQTCLANVPTSEADDYAACTAAKTDCDKNCKGNQDCLDTCENVYLACSANVGGSLGANRRAPMFKSSNSPLARLNICNPRLEVALQISLGLTQTYTGWEVDCRFSQMVKNWTTEFQRLKDISSQDFLQRLSSQFNPTGNDLGVAFALNSNLIEYQQQQKNYSINETLGNKGWRDKRNIAGELVGTPGEAEQRKKLADQALIDNIGKVTTDILVDASNILLNKLALGLWQNLTGNLTTQISRGNLSYYNGGQVGRASLQNSLNRLTEPVFAEGGKLDILSELATCVDPANPGPNDCVITSTFSDAVNNRLSVIEAVRSGRLNGDWPFGFDKNGEDRIPYNQGYPYRSLIILRKYRILPVGWELAAQEIQRKYRQNDFSDRPNGVTLNDLLACYSATDGITGYDSSWCHGLIDPNWILKVPEYYCARKGYGPQLLQEPTLVATGVKYCSADSGATIALKNDKSTVCQSDDDCCAADELARKDKLQADGNFNDLRNFICKTKCDYEEQKLSIYRNDQYCGDEQGCIKEGRNGSCLFYGYCTQERRTWIFNKDNRDQACDPTFNTCQAFRSPTGQRVSYLTDTLNFGCTQQGVGCAAYSYFGSYQPAGDQVSWDPNQSIYFNQKIGSCAANQEGCHEFIRIKDSRGVNLLADAGLEANDQARWQTFGSVVFKGDNAANRVYAGGYSLHVPAGYKGPYYDTTNRNLLPGGFAFNTNTYYSISAYVYAVSGAVAITFGNGNDLLNARSVRTSETGVWQQLVLTALNDQQLNADFWSIKAVGSADFYLDNIKVEIGQASDYSPYGSGGLVYEKLLPSYLEAACYRQPGQDYNLKDNAPAKCQSFARKCQASEVGCELYTETGTRDITAAQVKATDYCPAECVGYNTFIQKANNFYSARDAYFIPKTAKSCSAQDAGCSLFVNLDKVKTGGEENEYFSHFRRCVKPDASCGEFYTWEGSDQSGYQLVVYQLTENKAAGISQPATTDDDNPADTEDGQACNADIYALPSTSPDYNADCRQFYGRDGNVSYHQLSKTIVCSDQCYPYRLVNNNVDVTIASEADCRAVAFADGQWKYGFWDADKGQCLRCQAGGEWQSEHQACVYMADPTKSQTCGAAVAGCSEYEGDFGNSVRVIFNSVFESSNTDGWGPTAAISSEALNVGGHSLQIATINGSQNGTLTHDLKGKLKVGKRYTLSFLAKKKVNNASLSGISLSRTDGSGKVSLILANNVELSPDWKQYKFDIKINTADEVAAAERINLATNGQSDAIRFDNLKLLEQTDTYYLIKDSWTTPESCDQDLEGHPSPLAMIGCKQYTDRDNQIHNLKSFDKLCQNSAVGCELMVDTFNSSSYNSQQFGSLTVPADRLAYIVYEKSKECNSANKGCSRLGQSLPDGYKDVYLLNDPDKFDDWLCTRDQVGCQAWGTNEGGEVYFKEPGLNTCEFRQAGGGAYGWYKVKVKRCLKASKIVCDAGRACPTGQICNDGFCVGQIGQSSCRSDADCASGLTCQLLNIDESCAVSAHKTVGLGVYGDKLQPVGMAETYQNQSGQTVSGNAGLCPLNQDTCTEYIDPASDISYNLIAGGADVLNLKPYTLYVLQAKTGQSASLTCQGDIYRIDQDNNLVKAGPTIATEAVESGKPGLSEEFYIASGQPEVSCGSISQAVAVKEALVNYRLANSLNQDKPTDVNLDLGQVLFNARVFAGGRWAKLLYNTNLSQAGQAPLSAAPKGDNANTLLKVDPDRQCSQWLGCKSYVDNPAKSGDKICYERGLCDRLNDAGECISFVSAGLNDAGAPISQVFSPAQNKRTVADISNMTGYAKVGYVNNLLNADMYHLADMDQQGEAKIKFEGSFENVFTSGFTAIGDPRSRALVVKDAKQLENEIGLGSSKLIPDGRSVAKASQCVTKTVDGLQGRYYVASAYVLVRSGSQGVSLTISNADDNSDVCPVEAINDDPKHTCEAGSRLRYAKVAEAKTLGSWVRLTGKFAISNAYRTTSECGTSVRQTSIKVGICAPNGGLVYFDDVRIEPALKVKDQTYIHSDCRLYPASDAMSCDYYNDAGLRKKGWSGYCLEHDPKNPAACLLWYPIDKAESEDLEEGAGMSLAKDVYYCLDAEDQCNDSNKVEPEFYCKQFIKVNKDKYWYGRVVGNTNYTIPYQLLGNASNNDAYADFGVNAGGKTDPIILNRAVGSGLYGAYNPSFDLENYDQKITVGNVGKGLLPFVPYYGFSFAGSGKTNYYCRATLDSNGNDLPFSVEHGTSGAGTTDYDVTTKNKYDNCTVRAAVEGDFNSDSCSIEDNDRDNVNKGDACCDWDAAAGRCRISDQGDVQYCDSAFTCNYYHCIGHNFNGGECNPGLDPSPLINLGSNPDTRCSARQQTNNQYLFRTTDTYSDGNEVLCLFDCFNYTKYYRVARTPAQALEAVKRLFTMSDRCLTWNDQSHSYVNGCDSKVVIKPPHADCGSYTYCPDNVRPNYNTNNPGADYCAVRPTVSNVKLSDSLARGDHYELKGRGWVTLVFNSDVDNEQLPLKKYEVNWGYAKQGYVMSMIRYVNMYDRPSADKPHKVYYFLDIDDLDTGACKKVGKKGGSCSGKGDKCCVIRPSVTVTDNWQVSNPDAVESSQLDKDLVIWE